MSKTDRSSNDWLEVRIGGKRSAAFEEALLRKEQRLLDETMRELGAFLTEQAPPAKRRKAKKGGSK